MENRTILISGASVAGPALALWLQRYGFQPTVVERAPELRLGGYAVDFRGPAHLRVLERMGVLEAVRREQTRMGDMVYVDHWGRPLARLPAAIFSGDVEIMRGDLSRILYGATQNDVEYIFGDSIAGLEQDAGGVHVTFDHGPSRRFDLAVGADGVHSNVRRLAFGAEPQFFHGLGYHTAVFTIPNYLDLDHSGLIYNVPGKMVGVSSAKNRREAQVMLCFVGSPRAYDRHNSAQQKQILAETFAGVGWETPRLLDLMQQASDCYLDAIGQIRLDRWAQGRVSLLGDAAYCAGPGGNGTGMAVVGAYILAGELRDAGGDYGAAFARYEARMRDYVRQNQAQAAGAGFLVPNSRAQIWMRNMIFRTLPYVPWRGLIARMASKTASAIELPNYESWLAPAGAA